MKTFKNGILLLLILFSISCIVTSCSKEDETNKSVTANSKVSNYLKSFYPTNFQLGKSVVTKIQKKSSDLSKSIEVVSVVITEVFVGDDTRARGYVITDKSTNEFLYFLDVDRIDNKLTTVKVDVNDTETFKNIDELDKYLDTNQLDFIKIAEDVVVNPNFDYNKFFGWRYEEGPCGEAGAGLAYVYHSYFAFGIRIRHVQQYSISDSSEPLSEPCGFR